MTPYRLHLKLPLGWVELTRADGPALAAWAEQTAGELAADLAPDLRRGLATQLEQAAADSQTRSPLLAVALTGEPVGPVSVVLEVWRLEPDADVPLRIQDLAQQQARPTVDALLEPDVSTVNLPVGPALRVHRVLQGAAAATLQAAVVEELTYLVLPEQTPGEGLVVTASWVELADGEEYLGVIDRLVHDLEIKTL